VAPLTVADMLTDDNVFVKLLDGQLSSVKHYMTQCLTKANDDGDGDDVIVPHVNVDDNVVLSNIEPMLSVNKLPPNQRVLLQNLYEEVRDLLNDKRTEVDSMRECLQKAAVAYKVTILRHCLLFNGYASSSFPV